MENLVLLGPIDTHRLRCAVVGYLVVEGSKFRHLDEIAESFLLYDVVGDVKLEVGGLLGEDRRPRIEATDVLTLQFLGAEVFEEEIQLRQRVADGRSRQEGRSQVSACTFLYSADGKEHVECLPASLAVAESCHTVVTGVEHEVLELVALVHKQVVDAHHAEVHHIVGALLNAVGDLLQFHLQIELALFQPFEHSPRHILALCAYHLQVLLHGIKLRLQYLLLEFGRLRYLAELVVRHDDAVVVVVLDVVEEADTVLGRKILF